MTTEATTASTAREPDLGGQTVVLIGGSAGIGLEEARRACAEVAEVILTARDPERLKRAADDVGAQSTAAFATRRGGAEAVLRRAARSDRPTVAGPGYVPYWK